MKEHRIPGSLNQKKGEIEYNGHIRIDGGVKGNLIIKATGDIKIGNDCENANLSAGGDIIVRGNILGTKKNMVKAKGNIIAGGIRFVNVRCEGNIITSSRVENSTIKVCGQFSGLKTILRDCHITALGGILLHAVECSGSGASILHVGTNFLRMEELAFLKEKLEKKSFELQHLMNRLGPMLQRAIREHDYGLKMGLDIDTEIHRCRSFDSEIETIKSDLQKISARCNEGGIGCIAVNRAIQSGTQMNIKRFFKIATENVNGPVSFVVSEDNNSITKENGLLLREILVS